MARNLQEGKVFWMGGRHHDLIGQRPEAFKDAQDERPAKKRHARLVLPHAFRIAAGQDRQGYSSRMIHCPNHGHDFNASRIFLWAFLPTKARSISTISNG